MTVERINSLYANLGLTLHTIFNIVPCHIFSGFHNLRLI
jgi:hypothetical protein